MIDCFTFFNGLDILEIRLNCLAPFVERFVLVESPFNMVGKRKPLYFDENKERFKDFNITHLIVSDHEKHMSHMWEPYYYQLDFLLNGLTNVSQWRIEPKIQGDPGKELTICTDSAIVRDYDELAVCT